MTAISKTAIRVSDSIEVGGAIGFDSSKIGSVSYLDVALARIENDCNLLNLSHRYAEVSEAFQLLSSGWSGRQIGSLEWRSDVANDGSPFEFSLAFDRNQSELRFLVEPTGNIPSPISNWLASLEVMQKLKESGIDTTRFEAVSDLFKPSDDAKFALWIAVGLKADTPLTYKIYLNLECQGQSKAVSIAEEALCRLGHEGAWISFADRALARGIDFDRPVYLSLDLSNTPKSRVKVYSRHYNATAEVVDEVLQLAESYRTGDANFLCTHLIPDRQLFDLKPLISCLSWLSDSNIPAEGTIYCPLDSYVDSNEIISQRFNSLCDEINLTALSYSELVATNNMLESTGLHSYVSLRRQNGEPRVCVYFSPQLSESSIDIDIPKSSAVTDIWQHYQELSIADHPLLARMAREPVNVYALWLLFTNFHPAVKHFTERLAKAISRAEDMRIRSVLACQLNEELGCGNIEHIHTDMYEKLIVAVSVWQPEIIMEKHLQPGVNFDRAWDEIYARQNPYQSIGASILMEIQAAQFDVAVANQVRRTNLDSTGMEWLLMHEQVEVEHAHESLQVATFIDDSPQNIQAAIDGSRSARQASWKILDDIYNLCFTQG
jgi:DMATS type aromatic prenyltransferase